MASEIYELRRCYGLTQQSLAEWLGIPRGSVNMAERGLRALPGAATINFSRLTLASMVPPSPAPAAPDADRLRRRQAECQLAAARLRTELADMQTRFAQCQVRLRALPMLRAGDQTAPRAGLERAWLNILELEAQLDLDACDATAQALLTARISALDHEAATLEQLATGVGE